MSGKTVIENALQNFEPKQLIFANKLYQEKFSASISNAAYFKTIERLCQSGYLIKLAKGLYCRPQQGKFGAVPPSETEIVAAFTKNATGTVVGYSLYNSLQLTTQIGKRIEIFTSELEQQTKTVGNIVLKYYPLEYSEKINETIHMLEVLQNFSEIQDLNIVNFFAFSKHYAQIYSDELLMTVYNNLKYSKRTLAFLREMLEYYHVPNNLDCYLSAFSEYKYPKLEEIYEAARRSK